MRKWTLKALREKILNDGKDDLEAMTMEELLVEANVQLRKNSRLQGSFWLQFLAGVVRGLGAAVGATIIVWLLVSALKPLAQDSIFEPLANEIIEKLDSGR